MPSTADKNKPENDNGLESTDQKLKYPKSIFFIISNEFCERFSFYGMRTVLTLYLRNKLNYSDDTSTVIYHIFIMFVYFFPLVGAMLADSWLGKFRTIFYVSIIYALGQLLLAGSAAPFMHIPPREFSLLGLLLIALGTGGIKPCVAAFGGDQFILPQQERFLSTFFSLFYFAINSGSLISSFLTPVLRSSVTCFGETTCYSLAFFVPAALMTLSIVIFLIGKPMYKMTKPTGNVVLNVSKCITHAVSNKVKSKGQKKDHWLDHAEDKYERKLIDDIKDALQVLKLFLPLPVFWALFDQQGSRWTLQATKMDGQIGSFLLQPDQMQVFNPLLVLAFIPLFEAFFYPLLAKINLNTPLKKLTMGGILAAFAFVLSAIVELQLEKTYPVLPSQGMSQVRVYHTLNCPIQMTLGKEQFPLEPMSYKHIDFEMNGTLPLDYKVDLSNCTGLGFANLQSTIKGEFLLEEAKAVSGVVTAKGFSRFIDNVDKAKTGNPLIRGLIYVDGSKTASLSFMKGDVETVKEEIKTTVFDESKQYELLPGIYDVLVNNKRVLSDVDVKLGGVYSLIGYGLPSTEKYEAKLTTITEPNSIHILWLIPQYIFLTMGEVMFSVTGLEFAFTQAPISMKSLLQASWLLTVAFGNLIVVIVAEVSVFDRQVYEFILFAGLMLIDILIFAIIAKFYRYVEPAVEESICEETDMELKKGVANPSYRNDEN